MIVTLLLRYWWAVVIAMLVAMLGVQQVRLSNARSEFNSYRLEMADAQRKQAEMARQEDARRQQAVDAEAERARIENAALQADLARADGARDGLQRDLAAFKSRAARACPANGGKAQPGVRALDLLAELYGRADQEAGELAQYADKLRSAGGGCERSYNALR